MTAHVLCLFSALFFLNTHVVDQDDDSNDDENVFNTNAGSVKIIIKESCCCLCLSFSRLRHFSFHAVVYAGVLYL